MCPNEGLVCLRQSLGNGFQDFASTKIDRVERLRQSLGNHFQDVAPKNATVGSVFGSLGGTIFHDFASNQQSRSMELDSVPLDGISFRPPLIPPPREDITPPHGINFRPGVTPTDQLVPMLPKGLLHVCGRR